ncbi:PadR family transcriptional regulator [Kribbella sp. NPDC003505]|uniref:PadR family transcriptional regulator n=1 Tax=Kribbella sp. NPDC003505 TaxID=3154448 RepID=UPI0033AD6634
MAIQHAVLALLTDRPSYGYELKSAFESSIGPQWGPLNIGHLYQVLDRLSRDGLVTSERVTQNVKPDRVVYELTEAGRVELRRWLDEPATRSGGFRDDFFLKVMAAARTGDALVLRHVLSRQRTYLLHELRNLQNLRGGDDDNLVVALLLTAATRHVEADLAFVGDAEEALLDNGAAALAALRARLRPASATVDAAPTSSDPELANIEGDR